METSCQPWRVESVVRCCRGHRSEAGSQDGLISPHSPSHVPSCSRGRAGWSPRQGHSGSLAGGAGAGSLAGCRRSLLSIGCPIFAWAGSLPAIAGAWVRCSARNRPPMWHGDPIDGETKSVYWAFIMCYCLKSSSSTQLAGLPWEL